MNDKPHRRFVKMMRTREQILQDAFAKAVTKKKLSIIPGVLFLIMIGITTIILATVIIEWLGI